MNELSRHIEILLLDNDCVIVPGFGGFMTHHKTAVYLEDSGTFYPPQRTLGFNPQLQLNDSLLAQSYVESYDISYPEAVRRIENEVEEIRQILNFEGQYEFHGIGTITILSTGKYDFVPCSAGVLTPSLYALDSFQIDSIGSKAEVLSVAAVDIKDTEGQETLYAETSPESDYEEEDLHISYALLRNIMAVAMLLLFFVFASIPVGLGSGDVQKCSVIDTDIISSIIKSEKNTEEVTKAAKKQSLATSNPVDSVKQHPQPSNSYYTIVLASRVSKNGAEDYVSTLKKQGLSKASVFESGSSRKVIYGRYNTEIEAYQAIASMKKEHSDFAQAWSTEIQQ